VGSDHLELAPGLVLLSHSEGHYCGHIAMVEVPPARHHQLARRPQLGFLQPGEPRALQPRCSLRDQMERRGRRVDEGDKVRGADRHSPI